MARGGRTGEAEGAVTMEECSKRCDVAGFEEGERGHEPGNVGAIENLEKEMEPPEGMQPCQHLDLSPVRPVLNLRTVR